MKQVPVSDDDACSRSREWRQRRYTESVTLHCPSFARPIANLFCLCVCVASIYPVSISIITEHYAVLRAWPLPSAPTLLLLLLLATLLLLVSLLAVSLWLRSN